MIYPLIVSVLWLIVGWMLRGAWEADKQEAANRIPNTGFTELHDFGSVAWNGEPVTVVTTFTHDSSFTFPNAN